MYNRLERFVAENAYKPNATRPRSIPLSIDEIPVIYVYANVYLFMYCSKTNVRDNDYGKRLARIAVKRKPPSADVNNHARFNVRR